MHNFRFIHYSDRFNKELAAISPDAPRAQEFVDGLSFLLSRNPEIGTRVHGTKGMWYKSMTEIEGHPPVIVFYRFTRYHVYLESVVTSLLDESLG